MPRYLRVSDVPAIFADLQGKADAVFQLDAWQKSWVVEYPHPQPGAAVLSYRWRNRGSAESLDTYFTWLEDVRSSGYCMVNVAKHASKEWKALDRVPIQMEVAVWMMWLLATEAAELIWIDQFCVPQDADVETKMGHIRESPEIYRLGKVYVVLAPVVNYDTGEIMNMKTASKIVDMYQSEFRRSDLGAVAKKALLVNSSYMRRVWTIQEAVASEDLHIWPMKGQGELNSYQSLYVIDWPQFNAWNGWPGIGELRSTAASNSVIQSYLDGDFTSIIKKLSSHPSDGIAYLALISKEIMWITMDRNGLVNDLKSGDIGKRAHCVLNSHQVSGARCFLPEDKVLALVPLVDYNGWRKATDHVSGSQLVQASVSWAYQVLEDKLSTFRWSIRMYHSHDCSATHFDSLVARRNFNDRTSTLGAEDASIAISVPDGDLVLGDGTVLKMHSAAIMPHPGIPSLSWGGKPWTKIRDAIGTDEGFRLSVEWSSEMWLESSEWSHSRVLAMVVTSTHQQAFIIIGAIKEDGGNHEPDTVECKVLMVLDFLIEALPQVIEAMDHHSIRDTTLVSLVSHGAAIPVSLPALQTIMNRQSETDATDGAASSGTANDGVPVKAKTEKLNPKPDSIPAMDTAASSDRLVVPSEVVVGTIAQQLEANLSIAVASALGHGVEMDDSQQPPALPNQYIIKGGDARVEASGVETAAGPQLVEYKTRDGCLQC